MTTKEARIWKKSVQQLAYTIGKDDPKQVILDALGDALDFLPHIYGARVLVATAPSANKRGSIYIPDKPLDEGRYQGKSGLVLGWGPNAFKYDPKFPSYPWEGPAPKVGDWVYYRNQDTSEIGINGVSCRYVDDDMIIGDILDPEVVF